MTAVSVQTAGRKVARKDPARNARWARAASHKAAKCAVKPARTTATRPVAKYVWTAQRMVARTANNGPTCASPVKRGKHASPANQGRNQAVASAVAGSVVSRVRRVVVSVSSAMLQSRTRPWPTRPPWLQQ